MKHNSITLLVSSANQILITINKSPRRGSLMRGGHTQFHLESQCVLSDEVVLGPNLLIKW